MEKTLLDYTAMLAEQHIADLRREAKAERKARAARRRKKA
jgi:hypothetical protein